MSSLSHTPESRSDRTALGLAAAAGIPFVYALLSAAAHGYLDDSPEFSWQTLERPASPAALLARLCTLLPLGSLGLRLSLASALCLGALGAALYRSIDLILREQRLENRALRGWFALGACLVGLSLTPVFMQGVRPGAHAFTSALVLVVMSELSGWIASGSPRAASSWRVAFALGLLFAQDLSMFACVLPAATAGIAAAQPRPHARALYGFGLAASIRLTAGVEHGFVWFAPHPARAFELMRQLVTATPLLTLAALLGAIALAQTPRLRRYALLWGLIVIAPLLVGGSLLGASSAAFSSGMLGPVLPAAAVLAAALAGALLVPDNRPRARATRPQLLCAGALCAAGLFCLQIRASGSDLSDFGLTDAHAAASREGFPVRALVLIGDPLHASLARAHEAETHTRPDLMTLPLAQLGDLQRARALSRSLTLRPLLRSYLLDESLTRAALESLSAQRPVLLDADPTLNAALRASLRPNRLFFEVQGSRLGRAEERVTAAAYERDLQTWQEHATSQPRTATGDPAGREFLAHMQLTAANHFAAHADLERAGRAIARGRAQRPEWPVWDELAQAHDLELTRR